VRGCGEGRLGSGDVAEASEAIVMCAPDEQMLARIRAVVAAVEEVAVEEAVVEEAVGEAGCSAAVPSAGEAKAAASGKAEFAELLKAEFERLMVSGGGLTANQAAAQAMMHVKTTLASSSQLSPAPTDTDV